MTYDFHPLSVLSSNNNLIEKDHLGNWSLEKDCCWLTHQGFWIGNWLPHRQLKCQSPAKILLRTPITQMIFFNQGLLLLGSSLYSFSNNVTQPGLPKLMNLTIFKLLFKASFILRGSVMNHYKLQDENMAKSFFFLFSFHCTPCQHKLFGNVTSVQTQQTVRKKLFTLSLTSNIFIIDPPQFHTILSIWLVFKTI